MGYIAETFSHQTQSWLDAGWLQPGHNLIELGAQEYYSQASDSVLRVGAFLRHNGMPDDKIDALVANGLPSVRDIYEAIGVKYFSIDVDGAHGSTFFDLNTSAPPAHWKNTFDFVNNEGTIEHLVNPINGFQVAHEIAKVGGVIRHSFPLIGWPDHGFFYATPKFYAHMVGDNRYEKLRAAAVEIGRPRFEDPFFTTVDHGGNPLPPPTITDLGGELIYRKTSDRPFVIPTDHIGGPNADAVRQKLIKDFALMANRRSASSPAHPFTLPSRMLAACAAAFKRRSQA